MHSVKREGPSSLRDRPSRSPGAPLPQRTEHRERTTSGKERGGRVKLDIFRAISFARRLAQNVESLAEQALKP